MTRCAKPGQVYPEGKMSQYMDKMVLGDCLDFKGPKGRFTYQRNSKRAIGARHTAPTSARGSYRDQGTRIALVQEPICRRWWTKPRAR